MAQRQTPDRAAPRKPGRPGLENREMLMVRVPGEMLARIDALAGPGQRAAFVRRAIEAELAREARETEAT